MVRLIGKEIAAPHEFVSSLFGIVMDGPFPIAKVPAKIKGIILGVDTLWSILLWDTVPAFLD
jgi:hypothetical protein